MSFYIIAVSKKVAKGFKSCLKLFKPRFQILSFKFNKNFHIFFKEKKFHAVNFCIWLDQVFSTTWVIRIYANCGSFVESAHNYIKFQFTIVAQVNQNIERRIYWNNSINNLFNYGKWHYSTSTVKNLCKLNFH